MQELFDERAQGLFLHRLFDGDVQRRLVAQERCSSSVFSGTCDEGHALESEQGCRRRQHFHRLKEEACAGDHTAHSGLRLEEGTNLLQFLMDGKAWQAEHREVCLRDDLCRIGCNLMDGASQQRSLWRADLQLVLPTLWMACQQ